MKSIDILVAVRNEEKNVTEFVERMNEIAPKNVFIKFIFLEDGSSDRTVELLRNLSKNFDNIDYISFENKFGQYAALSYGLGISKADAIITMDVDGGHHFLHLFDVSFDDGTGEFHDGFHDELNEVSLEGLSGN